MAPVGLLVYQALSNWILKKYFEFFLYACVTHYFSPKHAGILGLRQ